MHIGKFTVAATALKKPYWRCVRFAPQGGQGGLKNGQLRVAFLFEERFNIRREVDHMGDQGTSTLAPEQEVHTPDIAQAPSESTSPGREFLFDTIASEGIGAEPLSAASPWKAALTGLLWVGYAMAIAVALVLVWSAARELLH